METNEKNQPMCSECGEVVNCDFCSKPATHEGWITGYRYCDDHDQYNTGVDEVIQELPDHIFD
jgi:hypothetical protein